MAGGRRAGSKGPSFNEGHVDGKGGGGHGASGGGGLAAFFDRQEAEGLSLVSDLQLYLDLYDYPLRGREQAERLFERRLGPKLAAAERV